MGDVFLLEAGRSHSHTVVLVHGVGDSGLEEWSELIPELATQYHVVAFDLPGFGRSTKANQLYSPIKYCCFIKWVVDTYVAGPFTLIGHSLGGALALRYAATFPSHLERLVLVDVAGVLHRASLARNLVEGQVQERLPATPLSRHAQMLRRLTDHTLRQLNQVPLDLDLATGGPSTRGAFLQGNPASVASLALAQENFAPLLHRITVPCLILWGSEDTTTPLRTGKVLTYTLPQARLELVPRAGHVPMRDAAQYFNRVVMTELCSPPVSTSQPRHRSRSSSERVGRCAHERDVVFVGPYQRIEIVDSHKVRLLDVTAESVSIRGSEVEIEGSRLSGPGVALTVNDTSLTITASHIEGTTPIVTTNSFLDLAGVTLVGTEGSLRAEQTSSTVVFSVCSVSSPEGERFEHRQLDLAPGQTL